MDNMAKKIESIKHKSTTKPRILIEDERFVWELAEKG